MSFTVNEVHWLGAHPGAVAAAEELDLTASSQLADLTRLRQLTADSDDPAAYARALAELVTARRGALRGAKIPDGPDGRPRTDWTVCSDSAQQATPVPVAQVRVRHLQEVASGRSVADVTCSVGSELAQFAAPGVAAGFGPVVGADLDPVRLAMARRNLPDIPLVRANAVLPAFAVDVVVADPARRDARGRIRDPRDLVPPLPDLLEVWRNRGAELAVKCAPGIDYSGWEGQVDVVSLAPDAVGVPGVKETCLYTPGLSLFPGQSRRAVVVGAGRTGELTSADTESEDVAPFGRYLLDPDGAVVRAGLVRQYAAQLGWWRIDPHIAYLSGDTLPGGEAGVLLPGQRVFEVLDTVPVKKLKAALRAWKCGSLEILVRGVDVDPDVLRKRLRSGGALSGTEALTVAIARVGRSPVAAVCRSAHPRG